VVFRADQEIGRDLAAVDWKSTPLGPVEGWPQSLRTAVSILLSSRFAMWMAWGPELTFFCNAAYRRDTLGLKYPWALGRPASEVWSEIWADVGSRIERVLTTGEATWDEALMLMLERSWLQRGVLPHVFVQPVARRRLGRGRDALRGQRRHRAGDRGASNGDAWRPGL